MKRALSASTRYFPLPLRACVALMLMTFSVSACKAAETATSQQSFGVHVEFQLGGGIAGVRQRLSVYDDGLAVARDDKRRTEVRRRLDSARLAEIKAAFAKVDVRTDQGVRTLSRPCVDCFQYAVAATIDSTRHQATISSNALKTSPYGEVMTLLSTILFEILSRLEKDRD